MLCPQVTPTNNCFPGIVDTDGSCFRYVDKNFTGNEQYLFSNYYREQIAQYGTTITYYVNGYNTLSADNFYGEDPTRTFLPGIQVNAVVELAENANMLTKFGFQADDTITIHLHISGFQTAFYELGLQFLSPTQELSAGVPDNLDAQDCLDFVTTTANVWQTQFMNANQVQPKSGDVFALTEYGEGRVGNRGAKYFEVTEILDEDIATTNQLGGHYTWVIKGKRYEYSFEPGLMPEKGDQQVYDNSSNGILSGGSQAPSEPKLYAEQNPDPGTVPAQISINDVSAATIFNMPANDNTDVYGGY